VPTTVGSTKGSEAGDDFHRRTNYGAGGGFWLSLVLGLNLTHTYTLVASCIGVLLT
jgi:hypothetical protein